jgi:GNAT superfamily N-acetyltransferase
VAIEITDRVRADQLRALYRGAWWAADRTVPDIERMLAHSDLVVGLVEDGRLHAFARVLTDFTYLALVLDVVAAAPARGTGLGARLMDAVVDHPTLAGVRSIELVCQPDLVDFYARWGFTDRVGGSRLMRRAGDRLAPST